MRPPIEGRGGDAAKSFSLEAEVEAWRKNRASRPVFTTGKVPVVRIRRRARAATWSAPLANRAFANTAR
jgi:hypothetical protein